MLGLRSFTPVLKRSHQKYTRVVTTKVSPYFTLRLFPCVRLMCLSVTIWAESYLKKGV
jgi:hypothetical protein